MPSIESKHVQTGGSPVEIAYIGTKEIKNDTLCRSGVTWFGQFDIQTVDPVAASRLLRFPSVFIRADKLEAYMEDLEESLAEDGMGSGKLDQDQDQDQDQNETEEKAETETETDTEQASDPAEDEAKAKAIEAIQTVIISLDQENPEHFTTKGKPKVEAVRTRMPDVEVSADDVAEAYKGLEVG